MNHKSLIGIINEEDNYIKESNKENIKISVSGYSFPP